MLEKLFKTLGLKSDNKTILSDNSQKDLMHDQVIKQMSEAGFSFVGNSLKNLGEVRVDLHTMYKIGKSNKMAGAYIEKIANMVGRYGFYLEDELGNVMDASKSKEVNDILTQCKTFFRTGYGDNKNFDLFCILYFTHIFSSGEIVLTANKLNDLVLAPQDGYLRVLDTRGINKVVDDFGNIKQFTHKSKNSVEKYTPMEVVNYIAYPDIDKPTRGLSKFNRIFMEALSNYEASSRQMYFFKNNAMPNVVVALEQMSGTPAEVTKKIDDFKNQWTAKFSGTENQGKPLISSVVKDIKVLDTNNVDMDLISLRKENDKDFAVIFLMDTRLIGINKETGSFGEVESTTIRQGNDQIDAYGEMLSETLNIIYRKFIDPNMKYTIKTLNAYFTNEKEERSMALKEIDSGVRTQNSYIREFKTGTPQDENEEMNSYISISRMKGAKQSEPQP